MTTCPLRARFCQNVAFPWVQCWHLECRAILAWRENEDDDRHYFEVLSAYRETQCVSPRPGFSFLKRGRGHEDPPEHFPYRCLRSHPEKEPLCP